MRPTPAASVFNSLDWTVVAIFIAVMFAITLYAMRTKAQSGKDYFLCGRDSNWLQMAPRYFHRTLVPNTWSGLPAQVLPPGWRWLTGKYSVG